MLAARDIDVYYGDMAALNGVGFEVAAGEVVSIIGSNGSGRRMAVGSEGVGEFSVSSEYSVPAADPEDIGVLAKDLFEPAINRLRKQGAPAATAKVSVGASSEGGDYQSRRGYRLREAE